MKTGFLNGWSRVRRVAGLAVAALVLAGCGEIYDRNDFTKLVVGKSEQEVTKGVGKPAVVDSSNPDRVTWTYNAVTFDLEKSNRRDPKTIVVFTRDAAKGTLRAAEVKYE